MNDKNVMSEGALAPTSREMGAGQLPYYSESNILEKELLVTQEELYIRA